MGCDRYTWDTNHCPGLGRDTELEQGGSWEEAEPLGKTCHSSSSRWAPCQALSAPSEAGIMFPFDRQGDELRAAA